MSETIELTPHKVGPGIGHFMPEVDIYETGDELVVLCDMPGVKPADLNVEFEKNHLSLYGEVSVRPLPGRNYDPEYRIGDYFRTFSIAPEFDADRISAECADGVVTLHVPKKESARPRRIAVNPRTST